ncbi:hypothetical protein ACW14Y_41295 [Kitasatospora sp. cg17-2]
MNSQVAHSAVSGLLVGGGPPAPGENPGGDGLIVTALEWVGRSAGMGVLGVLAVLAGGAWMWSRAPKATSRKRRRVRQDEAVLARPSECAPTSANASRAPQDGGETGAPDTGPS